MTSIVDSETGKIENWSIKLRNKFNHVSFKLEYSVLNGKELDTSIFSPDNWKIRIINDGFQTNYIKEVNLDEMFVITQSDSNYKLGKTDNNNNIEFLKEFFKLN